MKNKGIMPSVFLSLLIFTSCGKKNDLQEKPARYVITSQVAETPKTINKYFSGVVKGENESNLSFRVSGNFENKMAHLGDKVEKGEIVGVLDKNNYQIKYSESKANLAEAKANYTKATADYRRYKELFLNDNISRAEYDNAKAQYLASKAKVNLAQEKTNYAKLNLSYTNLLAPFTGEIVNDYKNVGENLKEGTPVFKIVSNENMEVKTYVPEGYIDNINLGDSVDIKIVSLNNKEIKGEIKEIGSGVNGIGNTLPVKIKISSDDESIKSGMTTQVILNIDNSENSKNLIVPISSVLEETNGNRYVYTVSSTDGKEKVKKIKVETGDIIDNNTIEILSGVNLGDKVVTAGINYLADGENVKTKK